MYVFVPGLANFFDAHTLCVSVTGTSTIDYTNDLSVNPGQFYSLPHSRGTYRLSIWCLQSRLADE